MSQDLLWSQPTKELLDAFCRRPQGSIYITGPAQSGRTTAIRYLVDSLTKGGPNLNPIEQLSGPGPAFDPQAVEDRHYRLDAIQLLLQRLSLAPPDPASPYLVVIDDFDRIAPVAQQALLKQLEEPGRQTSFILSASNAPGRVLATIISRCQPVEVRRPGRAETLAWVQARWPELAEAEAEAVYLKADGWPAAIADLLDQPETSAVSRQIEAARRFLLAGDGPAGRLAEIHRLTNETDADRAVRQLLAGLIRSSRAALAGQAAANDRQGTGHWQQRLLVFDRLQQDLDAGAGAKAVGLALSLFDQPRSS